MIDLKNIVNLTRQLTLTVGLCVPILASAQAWPTKPVRIVVPVAAGGTTDILARMVGQSLAQTTGQSFIVDGKPGAAGAIGSLEVARAPNDGYTLLLATSSTHSVAPAMSTQLRYDPVEDFTPIALVAEASNVLLVSPVLEVKNVQELLALARQKPGFLNYVSSGVGSFAHLSFELLRSQTGVSITHVPYKGTGATIADLRSGAVHLALDALPSGLPHVKEGRVKGLAVSGARRSSLAPDMPTIAESGVAGYTAVSWFGMYAPKALAADTARRINEEVNKVLHSQDMVAKFEKLGIEPGRGTPAEFAAMVAADRERWTRLVRERNIKAE